MTPFLQRSHSGIWTVCLDDDAVAVGVAVSLALSTPSRGGEESDFLSRTSETEMDDAEG